MKKMRRLTAFWLSALLVIGMMQGTVLAASPTPADMIDKYEASATPPGSVKTQYPDAIQKLYTGMMNYEASIDISEYNIPVGSVGALFATTIHTFPELFFVGTGYGGNYNKNTGTMTTFNPTYTTATKAETDNMLARFYEKADYYLAMVDDSMDDFTKALVLHDALAIHNEYIISKTQDEQTIQSTNYTFMVEGWGKCENYSECYAYLLAQLGIRSEIVTSDAITHEWMLIQLGNEDYYYNIDLTWDDPLVSSGGGTNTAADRPGQVGHNYFLLSRDGLVAADTYSQQKHTGYDSIHEGNDDAYDSHSNLHELEYPVFSINGKLYTLHKDNDKGYLATYNPIDDQFTDLLELPDRWYVGNTGSYYPYNFSGIGAYEDKLYYNHDNSVYVYDPVINRSKLYMDNVFDDGDKLYGLYVKNGKIIGLKAPDPNSVKEEVDLGYCNEIGAKLAGYSLSLEGDIGVNFYMELDDVTKNSDDAYMEFTIPTDSNSQSYETAKVYVKAGDGRTTASSVTMNGKEYYVFKCNVAAKEMTSDIKAQMIDGTKMSAEYTYSVQQYADYLIRNAVAMDLATGNTNVYQNAVPLVKAMLNYGAYAQIYFGNTNTLANAILSDAEKNLTAVDSSAVPYEKVLNLPYDTAFTGVALSLESETKLVMYFEGLDTNATFGCRIKGTDTAKEVEVDTVGGKQVVRIKGINARELQKSFVLTIDGTDSVTYGPMGYCNKVLANESSSEKLKNLVTALYWYSMQADAYFNS